MLPQCHNIDYLKSSLDMSILKEDEWYDVKNYKHKSNALLFNSRQPTTILQHLQNMKCINFCVYLRLLICIGVCLVVGKQQSSCIVRSKILFHMTKANYVAFICDEVISIDNKSWIFIHTYVVQSWARIPLLISIKMVVNIVYVDNLTIVLMGLVWIVVQICIFIACASVLDSTSKYLLQSLYQVPSIGINSKDLVPV